jgi:multiple sugar transport system ATP-binding protein
VYVTHDQTEAMTLGDRVAVLNEGRLQQVAAPQDLYDYPANRFVAEFVGEPAMNVFTTGLRHHDGRAVVDHDGFTVTLPAADRIPATDEEVAFGVRPEDISLAANCPSGSETFTATVTVREPLGELLLLHCNVGGGELRTKVEPRSEIYPGDTVELGFDDDRLHLFDIESGEAVYHSAPQPAGTSAEPSDAVPTQSR